jgi:hypothetical protein
MAKAGSRRNPIARDLGSDKYQQRVVKSSRRSKIDYLNRRDCEEELDNLRRFGYNDYLDQGE